MSLLAFPALAQDEDAERYTYATYFHCDAALESRADSIMKRDAPILDGLVADGTILAWGWLSHHTGGDWRRIRYHQAASPEAAMEALGAMNTARLMTPAWTAVRGRLAGPGDRNEAMR